MLVIADEHIARRQALDSSFCVVFGVSCLISAVGLVGEDDCGSWDQCG